MSWVSVELGTGLGGLAVYTAPLVWPPPSNLYMCLSSTLVSLALELYSCTGCLCGDRGRGIVRAKRRPDSFD